MVDASTSTEDLNHAQYVIDDEHPIEQLIAEKLVQAHENLQSFMNWFKALEADDRTASMASASMDMYWRQLKTVQVETKMLLVKLGAPSVRWIQQVMTPPWALHADCQKRLEMFKQRREAAEKVLCEMRDSAKPSERMEQGKDQARLEEWMNLERLQREKGTKERGTLMRVMRETADCTEAALRARWTDEGRRRQEASVKGCRESEVYEAHVKGKADIYASNLVRELETEAERDVRRERRKRHMLDLQEARVALLKYKAEQEEESRAKKARLTPRDEMCRLKGELERMDEERMRLKGKQDKAKLERLEERRAMVEEQLAKWEAKRQRAIERAISKRRKMETEEPEEETWEHERPYWLTPPQDRKEDGRGY